MTQPFHLALPVPCLDHISSFYIDLLKCKKGRSDNTWIDLNFWGHQLVFHLVPSIVITPHYNPVESHQVPIPHFGVILKQKKWDELAHRLQLANTTFIIEPYTRFQGKKGAHSTLFFQDPVGYHLEFKSFHNDDDIFNKGA